jgi:hypothetical protein
VSSRQLRARTQNKAYDEEGPPEGPQVDGSACACGIGGMHGDGPFDALL